MQIRETGCAEEFGDIRQAFDMYLDRAKLVTTSRNADIGIMSKAIFGVQDALDKLGVLILSRDRGNENE